MELALNNHIETNSEEAKEVLYRAISRIQEKWEFNNAEMARLLHVKANTYGNWMNSQSIPIGKAPHSPEIELVIACLSIFRSLGAMFKSHQDQILWLKSSHPDFYHQSPLEFAQNSCENIYYLKQYLDYVRGRGA